MGCLKKISGNESTVSRLRESTGRPVQLRKAFRHMVWEGKGKIKNLLFRRLDVLRKHFSDLFDFAECIFYKPEVFFEAVVHIEAKGGADYGSGDAADQQRRLFMAV